MLHNAGVVDTLAEKPLAPFAEQKLKRWRRRAGDRLKVCSDIIQYGAFFYRDPQYDEVAFKKRLGDDNIRKMVLQFVTELGDIHEPQDFDKAFHDFCETKGLKPGDMVHAVRIAITGQPITAPVCLIAWLFSVFRK
jgi:hypothetical protein